MARLRDDDQLVAEFVIGKACFREDAVQHCQHFFVISGHIDLFVCDSALCGSEHGGRID